MKKLFFSLLFIQFVVGTAIAKSKVAAVFANKDLCKTKMCLHGKFKRGTSVVLLSKAGEETCTARVGSAVKVDYSAGAFEASELMRIKNCKIPPSQVFLAVFEKPKLKYKIYSVDTADSERLKSLDKDLKKNRAFAKAWKKEVYHKDGNKDRVVYQLNDYKLLSPMGYASKVSKKEDLFILRHQFGEGLNDGVSFSFYKKEWSAVSSSFTEGKPFIFSINGRIMMINTVTCQLSCGYQDTEVYEFNGKIFKLIYNNADFST
jgi:hypothetical protein